MLKVIGQGFAHVAVVSVFTPAGLIGVDHRAASDTLQYARQFGLRFASHFACGIYDGAQAEAQPMHGVQVPLDGAQRQPSLLPQGRNQADDVDPQTLLAHHHAVQLRFGATAASALWTGAGQVNVLGYLRRNLGQVDHLPSALGPASRQVGPAVGTLLHRMLHSVGGRHPASGKAVRSGFAWPLGTCWLPVRFGLQTGHPAGAAGFGLAFQLGNPLLQPLDDGLLADYDANQDISVGGPEIDFSIHPSYMT